MNQYIIWLTGNTWYSLNIGNDKFAEGLVLNSRHSFITFQVSDFIRYIKSENKNYVPEIINLESLDKQFSQSGKDILGQGKWHILKSLRRMEIIRSDYKISEVDTFIQLIKDFY